MQITDSGVLPLKKETEYVYVHLFGSARRSGCPSVVNKLLLVCSIASDSEGPPEEMT